MIPNNSYNVDTSLQNNDKETVALILAYNGIIPPA